MNQEKAAFLTFYPAGYLHSGVDSIEDLARVSGVLRQREMLAEYAKRKLAGQFPEGPEVRT